MSNIISAFRHKILFIGHLDDHDDLKKYKRDGPIIENEKTNKDLMSSVSALAEKVRQEDKKAIIFITSSKIRTIQTAKLVANKLKQILKKEIKIRFHMNDNLKGIEQGELILPIGYVSGDFFEGLDIASKIFFGEFLNPTKTNLNYRFGDPVDLGDGHYKYPELLKYFSYPGETYGESITRIFKSVVELAYKSENIFKNSIEIVLVGHGFTFHILNGLSIISKELENDFQKIDMLDLIKKIWSIYEANGSLRKVPYLSIDISNLNKKLLVEYLEKQILLINNAC